VVTQSADDVSITGEISHVLTGIRSVHRVLEEGGIPLNVTKTQMVCDQKDVDTAKRAGFNPVERADLLGGVVAAKHVKTIELKDTRARYRQYAEGLNRSVKDLPAQTANILLRHLVRMVGYVLSTCDTKRVTQWCADMTKLQTDCFEKIMGVKLADRARRQICLRDEDGGNELVDWTEVQKVAHAALIQVTLDKELKAQPSLVKYKIEEHRKAAGKAFWDTRRGVDVLFPRMQQRVYAECRYQFNNIKPETDDLVLGDMQFKTMMAVRLGMQETSFIPSVCPTEKERNEQCSTVDHALACRMCAGHYHTQRHERISHAIVRTLRTAGIHATSSPGLAKLLGHRDNSAFGPDVFVYSEADDVLAIDVSVAHQSGVKQTYAALKRSHEKVNKYSDMAELMGWKFEPLVFTSIGHPTEQALKTLVKMCSGALERGTKKALIAAATIACARGSAATLIRQIATSKMYAEPHALTTNARRLAADAAEDD
jgi:hypothetical protein